MLHSTGRVYREATEEKHSAGKWIVSFQTGLRTINLSANSSVFDVFVGQLKL